MSVIVRLAKLEDQQQCSELLNVLAKATSDSHEIFDSETFEHLISNERGSLVVAEESGNVLGNYLAELVKLAISLLNEVYRKVSVYPSFMELTWRRERDSNPRRI